jgi:hypothetical protein
VLEYQSDSQTLVFVVEDDLGVVRVDLLAVSLDVEEEADDERRVVLEVELSTGQSDLE